MDHTTRLPVRYLESNREFLEEQSRLSKALEAPSGNRPGQTDLEIVEGAFQEDCSPKFRAPGDRNLGNVLFRRYPNGDLDLENGKHIVVDILHKMRDKLPLTDLERTVLGVFMPTLFPFVDSALSPSLAAVHLRVTPDEIAAVNDLVALHLKAEMNYNAGIGGSNDKGKVTNL